MRLTFAEIGTMYTQEEKDFMEYWEKNRGKSKKQLRQWLFGIPLGLAIVVPTLLNFSSNWYKRAKMEAYMVNPLVLLIAVLVIVAFITIFYRYYQRDRYEQRYLELKALQDDEPARDTAAD
ncbi:MAG: hypothetical protein QM664_01445 [Flavihumibacter sp.]